MEQPKEDKQVIEVPIFITEEDTKRMMYLVFMKINEISKQLEELNKYAKDQDGTI